MSGDKVPINMGGDVGAVVLNLRDKWAKTPTGVMASIDALTPRKVRGDDYRIAWAAMRLLERFGFLTPERRFGDAPGMFRRGPRWADAVEAAEADEAVRLYEAEMTR